MTKTCKIIGFLAVCAMLLVPMAALADSISPSTVTINASTSMVTSVKIHKTVTVSAASGAQADIFFLSDTTGSMGSTIATVQANAAAIMASTAATIPNTAWGVGNYRDGADGVDYGYQLNQAITTNQALVQAGINTWVANGGGDTPEDNLYGVRASTTDAASGWRTGDTARILVQFGDAPGHDPASDGTTLATATTALTSTGTKLIAVDVGNKNAVPNESSATVGQETTMVNASGGTYLHNPDQSTLVAAVEAAITSAVLTYHTVALQIVPDPVTGLAPTLVSFPDSYTGDYTRDMDRNFDFDIVLSGCCRAFDETSFNFDINALVDGLVVATEHDRWNCAVPVPPTLILLGSGLLGLIPLRKRIKLT